jgi:hypothetical protein
MKYIRITAVYAWTDCTANTEIAREHTTALVLGKKQEYRRN